MEGPPSKSGGDRPGANATFGAGMRNSSNACERCQFFHSWRRALYATDPATAPASFITEQCWFDWRLSILGFIAMCRYIFADESLVVEPTEKRATKALLRDTKNIQ